MKKSEQLFARAAQWQLRVDGLKTQAAAAVIQEIQEAAAQEAKQQDVVEAAARRAINDWSAPRIRTRMQEVRKLQAALMKDYAQTEPRVRALDRLFNELRVRAEGIERAEIERKVYAEWSGAEAERRIEALWEEHRRSV